MHIVSGLHIVLKKRQRQHLHIVMGKKVLISDFCRKIGFSANSVSVFLYVNTSLYPLEGGVIFRFATPLTIPC